jgi:hypothetical protein
VLHDPGDDGEAERRDRRCPRGEPVHVVQQVETVHRRHEDDAGDRDAERRTHPVGPNPLVGGKQGDPDLADQLRHDRHSHQVVE